nr:MAG TPA: hypothetical protein [Caudoviricetes sp.]
MYLSACITLRTCFRIRSGVHHPPEYGAKL